MNIPACLKLFSPAIVFGVWALVALAGVEGDEARFTFLALASLAFAVHTVEQLRLHQKRNSKRG